MASCWPSHYFRRLFFLAWLLCLIVPFAKAQDCSATKPCTEGCCSTAGYCGLGPDYCASGKCVANCDQKAECNPGWADSSFALNDRCPLNVCCSKYGHCGTTKDFCGNATVQRPSCSKDRIMNRVIGYYEGWNSYSRPCNKFYPEQIPTGAYTHLNFAFASVDPETYAIVPADNRDKLLYTRLTDLKLKDPNLKVFISIGGWTFNDPGPTRKIFGELASDPDKRLAFLRSLTSFMSTYNFDGVDIDWEYPGADDRGGTPDDYANFVFLIQNMKLVLTSIGRPGLTITLPASFWYLQHFDIINLSRYVDWFNIMSYDLHGTWDQGNKWEGPYLNAHTNLTEITQALDLVWRNLIDPNKIVLGIAFYGRSFTLAGPCTAPGCPYVSGGDAQPCSNTVGIILNNEINSIISTKGLTPELNQNASVKIATWDNQWVAYDDPDTFQLKVDFAKQQCMSGVMVWAVSQDTQDGYYSKALAKVVNRPVPEALTGGDQPFTTTKKNMDQCRWSNCHEKCPSGWIAVADKQALSPDAVITDKTGCLGFGVHTFCCPGDQELPRCGMYGWFGGNCKGGCPTDMSEVGTSHDRCGNTFGYESACCTVTSSTAVYGTCAWDSASPDRCPDSKCSGAKSMTAVRSTTGSGADFCNIYDIFSRSPGSVDVSVFGNSLCCDDSNADVHVDSCQWYTNLGPVPVDGGCISNCPSGTIRLAMDQFGGRCGAGGGAEASCCHITARRDVQVENGLITIFRDGIQKWAAKPTCAHPGVVHDQLKRDLGRMNNWDSANFSGTRGSTDIVSARALSTLSSPEDITVALLIALLGSSVGKDIWEHELEIWDNAVNAAFPFLIGERLFDYLSQLTGESYESPSVRAHDIVCRPHHYNTVVEDYISKSKQPETISCNYSLCEIEGAGSPACSNDDAVEEGDEDDPTDSVRKRGWYEFVKRIGGARRFNVNVNGRVVAQLRSLRYPQASDFDPASTVRNAAYVPADVTDCVNIDVDTQAMPPRGTNEEWPAEHIVELQTIGMFLAAIGSGTLPSGNVVTQGAVDPSFMQVIVNATYLAGSPIQGAGGYTSNKPADLLYNCLGSMQNQGHFVITERDLNEVKARIWKFFAPTAIERIKDFAENPNDVGKALASIQKAFLVLSYLREPLVHQNLLEILRCILNMLDPIGEEFNDNIPMASGHYNLPAAFREFINDHLTTVSVKLASWAREALGILQKEYPDPTTTVGGQVAEVVNAYLDYINEGMIDIDLTTL